MSKTHDQDVQRVNDELKSATTRDQVEAGVADAEQSGVGPSEVSDEALANAENLDDDVI